MQSSAEPHHEEEDEEEEVPITKFGNLVVDDQLEKQKMKQRKANLDPDQLAPAHMVHVQGERDCSPKLNSSFVQAKAPRGGIAARQTHEDSKCCALCTMQ